MSADAVEVSTERLGTKVLVRLVGEIDLSSAPEANLLIRQSLDDADALVLDLAGLRYLDSAGLAMVAELARECSAQGRSFGLVVPDDSIVRTAFTVSGLDQIVAVHRTTAEAM